MPPADDAVRDMEAAVLACNEWRKAAPRYSGVIVESSEGAFERGFLSGAAHGRAESATDAAEAHDEANSLRADLARAKAERDDAREDASIAQDARRRLAEAMESEPSPAPTAALRDAVVKAAMAYRDAFNRAPPSSKTSAPVAETWSALWDACGALAAAEQHKTEASALEKARDLVSWLHSETTDGLIVGSGGDWRGLKHQLGVASDLIDAARAERKGAG